MGNSQNVLKSNATSQKSLSQNYIKSKTRKNVNVKNATSLKMKSYIWMEATEK